MVDEPIPAKPHEKPTDTSSLSRELLQPDLQAGGAERLAGAALISTPAMPVGKAVVADPREIVMGYGADVEVSFSEHAQFTANSVVVGVVARLDWAANDAAGLVLCAGRVSPPDAVAGPPTHRVVVVQLWRGPLKVMSLAPTRTRQPRCSTRSRRSTRSGQPACGPLYGCSKRRPCGGFVMRSGEPIGSCALQPRHSR